MRRAFALTLVLIVGAAIAAMAGSFDARAQSAIDGTATVTGTIVTAERPPAPVVRVEVTLSGGTTGPTRKTLTDETGSFRFESVAAGKYTLTGTRSGYVTGAFGSTRPGGPGAPLVVNAGDKLTGLAIELTRAGAISGVVRSRHGEPLAGVGVSVFRLGFDRGMRAPTLVGKPIMTDDRGQYRFFGLAPGDYFVSVPAKLGNTSSRGSTATTAEDLARAKQILAGKTGTGVPSSAPLVDFPQTFHPSATSLPDAMPIRVSPGAESAGVDVTVIPKPVLTISGTTRDSSAGAMRNFRFWARDADVRRSDNSVAGAAFKPDGSFSLAGVFPGRYVLHARATRGATSSSAGDRATHWGRLEVQTWDVDVTNLVMNLEPMLAVSGRVRVDGADSTDLIRGASISLMDADETVFSELPTTTVGADGTFTFTGVAAARYRLVASAVAGLTLKSAMANEGIDLVDALIDLRSGIATPTLNVTYTARTTLLSGTLRDAAERPLNGYVVVAFAADRRYWTAHSRRIQSSRSATDGSFAYATLPPGDYLLAAVTDAEDGQWLDPSWLEELLPHAVKVTIPDGGRVVQNLQVKTPVRLFSFLER